MSAMQKNPAIAGFISFIVGALIAVLALWAVIGAVSPTNAAGQPTDSSQIENYGGN